MTIASFQRYPLGLCTVTAILAGCAGSQSVSPAVSGVNAAAYAAPGSKTFHYTGAPQTFTVPRGVKTIVVVARGAAGGLGRGGSKGAQPGRGVRVYAILPVKPEEKLFVFVGGQGSPGSGGFNGGGAGGRGAIFGHHYPHGGGGGGASDLRLAHRGLLDRILVAAGGGGAGQFGWAGFSHGGDDPGGNGGPGGGSIGGSGTGGGVYSDEGAGGSGGTQSAGGAGGAGGEGDIGYGDGGHGKMGALANGGAGGRSDARIGGAGGGGGGGYYGGGGGGGGGGSPSSGPQGAGGGGGGGSSYVEPSAIKFRFWGGWKNATGDGQIVISWQ